jgi:hypothetical protein
MAGFRTDYLQRDKSGAGAFRGFSPACRFCVTDQREAPSLRKKRLELSEKRPKISAIRLTNACRRAY